MSRRGQKEQKVLLLVTVTFVVIETTSAWYGGSSSCGEHQEARQGNGANTNEKPCNRDGMNAQTYQKSKCTNSAGSKCVCMNGFFRKGPHDCGPCVRVDQC
uniref:Uncharacterized protein n=1 Tax=Rhipicephalus zambeziensis TaxID=60191 RepID=A0A224Y997_9ACAR